MESCWLSYLVVVLLIASFSAPLALVEEGNPLQSTPTTLSQTYWIDSTCGNDENDGSSPSQPFATLAPLELLILPSYSLPSLSILLSPGTYHASQVHWPFSTSLHISRCSLDCPKCPSGRLSPDSNSLSSELDSGEVVILARESNSSRGLPPFYQVKTLEHGPGAPVWFENLVLRPGSSLLNTSLIKVSNAAMTLQGVSFEYFTMSSLAHMLEIETASNLLIFGCRWRNNTFKTLQLRNYVITGTLIWSNSPLDPEKAPSLVIRASTFENTRIDGRVSSGLIHPFSWHQIIIERSCFKNNLAMNRFNDDSDSEGLVIHWDIANGLGLEDPFQPSISISDSDFIGNKLLRNLHPQPNHVLGLPFPTTPNGKGGVFNFRSSLQTVVNLHGCRFIANEASYGGAIFFIGGSDASGKLLIHSSRFSLNVALQGAAIYALEGSLELEHIYLEDNWITKSPRSRTVELAAIFTNRLLSLDLFSWTSTSVSTNIRPKEYSLAPNIVATAVTNANMANMLFQNLRLQSLNTGSLIKLTLSNTPESEAKALLMDIVVSSVVTQYRAPATNPLAESLIFVTSAGAIYTHSQPSLSLVNVSFGNPEPKSSSSTLQALYVSNLRSFVGGLRLESFFPTVTAGHTSLFSFVGNPSLTMRQVSISNVVGGVTISDCDAVSIYDVRIHQIDALLIPVFEITGWSNILEMVQVSATDVRNGPVLKIGHGDTLILENSTFTHIKLQTRDGSAVYVTDVVSLRVLKSHFEENQAPVGAAIFGWNILNVEVHDCVFGFNKATTGGGSAMRTNSQNFLMTGSWFIGNTAPYGGAIEVTSNSIILDSNNFTSNQALFGSGGAVSFTSIEQEDLLTMVILIRNCHFDQNRAAKNGGAIIVGGDIDYRYRLNISLSLTIDGVLATKNTAGIVNEIDTAGTFFPPPPNGAQKPDFTSASFAAGGFISMPYPRSFILNGSMLKSNGAELGGSIHIAGNIGDPGLVLFKDSTFAKNYALFAGGAIHMTTDFASEGTANPSQRFQGLRVEQNSAPWGGAVSVYGHVTSAFYDGSNTIVPGTSEVIEMSKFTEDQRQEENRLESDGLVDAPRRNSWSHNIASYGGVVFYMSIGYRHPELKFWNQTFFSNQARAGAIAFYDQVDEVRNSWRPCDWPNFCDRNRASDFGTERATWHSRFEFASLIRAKRSIEVDIFIIPKVHSEVVTIQGERLDDFDHPFKTKSAERIELAVVALPGSDTRPVLSGLVSSTLTHDGSVIIQFLLLPNNTEGIRRPLPFRLAANSIAGQVMFESILQGCPTGHQFNQEQGCILCGVGTYSWTNNGVCLNCSNKNLDCRDGEVLTTAGHYVFGSSTEDHEIVAETAVCPIGYCLGGNNECSNGRTGFACGICSGAGYHESWTTSCTSCDGVNWSLVSVLFIALWIITMLLHLLIAKSSGKSTILLYFVQTSYFIIKELSFGPLISHLSGSSVSGSTLVHRFNWLLCLFPMNSISRQLFFASIPFVMALQLCLTFGLHRLWLFTRHLCCTMSSQTNSMKLLSQKPLLVNGNSMLNDDLLSDSDMTSHEEAPDKPLLSQSDSESGLETYDTDGLLSENGWHEVGLDTEIYVEEEPIDRLKPRESSDSEDDAHPTTPMANFRRLSSPEENLYERLHFRENSRFFHSHRFVRTILSLFAQSYSSISGLVMLFMTCASHGDRYYLSEDPSISCRSDYYQRWRLSLILSVPWMAAVVIIICTKLIIGRQRGTLSKYDVRFGIWYEMFKSRWYLFKLFELFRRTLIGLPVLYGTPTNMVNRGATLAVMLMLMLLVQLLAQPYIQRIENLLASISAGSLVLLALMTTWNPRGYKRQELIITSLALALISIVVFLILLGFGYVTMKTRLQLTLRKFFPALQLKPDTPADPRLQPLHNEVEESVTLTGHSPSTGLENSE